MLHQEVDELQETLNIIRPPLTLTAEIMSQEYRKAFKSLRQVEHEGGGVMMVEHTASDGGGLLRAEVQNGPSSSSAVSLPCPECALESVISIAKPL